MTVGRSKLSWMADDLDDLETRGLCRRRVVIEKREPGHVTIDGRRYVDVSSNDYLGLAGDARVVAAGHRAALEYGWGATASPLVGGYHRIQQELEEELARFEGTEAAVVFPSGFSANLGTLAALVGPGDVVFSDRRNHASLIDGCRLSKAEVRIYDGRDLETLESLLKSGFDFERRLIVTDGVFSMDGDIAPMREICELADRHDALVYVDEAHATGVLGTRGRGVCELLGVEDQVDFRMGTLSKGLGGVGGFLAGTRTMVEWLVNWVRPYIYSTGLPPAAAAASLAALQIARSERDRAQRVMELARSLRDGLRDLGMNVGDDMTPIVPLIVGEPERAIAWGQELRASGFWGVAIRPPTVAEGTARVRISLSAAHDDRQMRELVSAVARIRSNEQRFPCEPLSGGDVEVS